MDHKFAVFFVLGAGVLAIYYFVIRPVISQYERFKPLFDRMDEVHATWVFKLLMLFKGLRVWIIGWLGVIVPMVIALLSWMGTVPVDQMLPEEYRALWPIGLSAVSGLFLWLRTITTGPVGEPVPSDVATELYVPTKEGHPDAEMVITPSTQPEHQIDVTIVMPPAPRTGDGGGTMSWDLPGQE